MTLNKHVNFDKTLPDFDERVKELAGQNLRMISLSMYGDPKDPRFSAVWDERPSRVFPLKHVLGKTREDFEKICGDNIDDKFFPVLVSATGGGSNARFSGVFEKAVTGSTPSEMSFHQSLDDFNTEVNTRAESGVWMIRNATIYDDVKSGARVTAIWQKNSQNTAWNVFAGITEGEHKEIFTAQSDAWARLAFVTASTQHRFLAVYRDDHVAAIGTGFAQEFYTNTDDFKAKRLEWVEKGFFHQYFQGFGFGAKRRYVALYVVSDKPVQRMMQMTGSPEVSAIDEAVIGLMKASNIRGASLAIVKDTRLVLARAYTWAEPDYPTVKPTTYFRLASCSKLVAALALHQLVGEGKVALSDLMPDVMPLEPPSSDLPTIAPYSTTTVGGLLDNTCTLNPDYEQRDEEIVKLFKNKKVPAAHEQIESFMMTQPATSKTGPNDGGFFLSAQLVKRKRKAKSFIDVIESGIIKPLGIKRLRVGHTLIKDQAADDARQHGRELGVRPSIMSSKLPLAPYGYGQYNLGTMEASGGLAAAAPDLARILAAMNAAYTPLGRTVVDTLLEQTVAGVGGHGFDGLFLDPENNLDKAWKGGMLEVGQTGLVYQTNDLCYVILWNGMHTGKKLRTKDDVVEGNFYPVFNAVLDAAAAHAWPSTDLFPDPDYGMPSFPDTQGNWRRCIKCQSLFLGGQKKGDCPGDGKHDAGTGRPPNYHLMVNSQLEYGQTNWRRCEKCRCLFFDGKNKGKCAAGGVHDLGVSSNYSLVVNSPYKEHEQNWRRCKKCQTLFFEKAGSGKCAQGGSHDSGQSGVYSVAKI